MKRNSQYHEASYRDYSKYQVYNYQSQEHEERNLWSIPENYLSQGGSCRLVREKPSNQRSSENARVRSLNRPVEQMHRLNATECTPAQHATRNRASKKPVKEVRVNQHIYL